MPRIDLNDSRIVAIPDANTRGVTRTLVANTPGTVANVRVEVDISHTNIGDLTVQLVTPSRTRVMLHDRAGGAADNIVRSWRSSTDSQLLPVVGERADGPWRLKVIDHVASGTGRLNRWRLLLGVRAAAPYNLRSLPTGLRIHWPNSPTTARDIEITSIPEDGLRIDQPRTRYEIRASGRLTVAASDVDLTVADGFEIEQVFIEKSVKRVRFLGGRYRHIAFQVPASYPGEEWHEDWMVEDVLFDRIEVNTNTTSAPPPERESAFVMRGKRIAVLRSRVHARHYCVWVGGTGPFQSQNIILAGNVFESDGPEATVRFQPVLRSVVVDNQMSNPEKHNYRVHGVSDLAFAARNTFIHAGVKLATEVEPEIDEVGRVWLNDNVFHHTLPSLLDLDAPLGSRLQRFVATGNTVYSDIWHFFVDPETRLPRGWEIRDNTFLPYRPFVE